MRRGYSPIYATLISALLLQSCVSFCMVTGGTWAQELNKCSRTTGDGGMSCTRGGDCEAGLCLVDWSKASIETVREGRCAERTNVRYYGGFCKMVDRSEALPGAFGDPPPADIASSTTTWVQCSIID